MVAEFKKDLSSNYMVLCPNQQEEDSFSLKMLTRNKIDGLLKMEIKMIDDQKYYYYDITSKQPLSEMIKHHPISFWRLQKIYQKIFRLPDVLKEYLISENGIFMEPDFIYTDPAMDTIEFCYYPEGERTLQEQVAELTEYLMNRVDYKDETAVLAVYAIYQVSHDKNCTLKKLKEVFEKRCGERNFYENPDSVKNTNSMRIKIPYEVKEVTEKSLRGSSEENNQIQKKNEQYEIDSCIKKLNIQETNAYDRNNTGIPGEIYDRKTGKLSEEVFNKKNNEKISKEIDKNDEEKVSKKILDILKEENAESRKREYPHMEERIENQKEVMKYPAKVYVQAAVILSAGLFILFVLLKTGTLNRNGIPDIKRYVLVVFCYIAVELIGFFLVFRKENQCAEIEEEIDYIDWEDDYSLSIPEIRGLTLSEPIEGNYYQDAFLKETGNSSNRKESIASDYKKNFPKIEEEDAVTELLIDFHNSSIAYLESEFSGERIYLKKFPFLVGKLKKGTDYVLESSKISRIHAKFNYDDSHYYIEDMDSTNGTSLNGESLCAHNRKILADKDRVCFADKNFIFHC